jgi:hypothetical protein
MADAACHDVSLALSHARAYLERLLLGNNAITLVRRHCVVVDIITLILFTIIVFVFINTAVVVIMCLRSGSSPWRLFCRSFARFGF